MGLCQMLTKGHSMHNGKNSSSCVTMEYSSQANTANPHFFGSAPLPRWFLGRLDNLFIFVAILYWLGGVVIWFPLCYNKMLLRKNWKNWKKICPAKIVETRTGRGRAFDPPLIINGAKPFCYLIFPLLAKPTTRGNENNSHLIFFHILLVRIILQQRGRFICKSFSFAFYYLLYYVVNSKVLLFVNNYHLRCVIICKSFSFENHNQIIIICIWIS